MPAITTHHIFAEDVYSKLSKDLKKKLGKSYDFYLMFSQSFDFFLYSPKKRIRKMQRFAHTMNTQSYFINLVRNIKEEKLENKTEALTYLFGSINHYVLDSIAHPFVLYKSGFYDKNNKDTFKYRGMHTRMEFMLDSYFYEAKHKKRFYKYKFINDLFPKLKPSKELKNLMNSTYRKTYNKDNMDKYFFKSYRLGRKLYRLFIYDPFGIKKFSYKIWDSVFKKGDFSKQDCSFYIKDFDFSLLNIDHKEWHHPCDERMKFNYSFLDLYDMAVKRSVYIMEEVEMILKNEKDIKELINIMPNISYLTGLSITKNTSLKPLQYFEF